jgi:hypothetical protein
MENDRRRVHVAPAGAHSWWAQPTLYDLRLQLHGQVGPLKYTSCSVLVIILRRWLLANTISNGCLNCVANLALLAHLAAGGARRCKIRCCRNDAGFGETRTTLLAHLAHLLSQPAARFRGREEFQAKGLRRKLLSGFLGCRSACRWCAGSPRPRPPEVWPF